MKTGMTKKQLMALAGISDEAEFYRKFPDEKSFFAKYGKKIEKANEGFKIPFNNAPAYQPYEFQPQGIADIIPQAYQSQYTSEFNPMKSMQSKPMFGNDWNTLQKVDSKTLAQPKPKQKGEGLANLVNPANKLIQGVEQLFQERKQMKRADQWNQVSDLQLQAARTSPEEIERKYIRPEDMVISPGQVFPQNFAKSGKKVKKANFGSVVGNINKAGGFDVVSNYAGKAFDYNAGSQIGGAVGDAVKFIPGVGPVVSAIAKPVLTAIGGAVDPYAKKIKKYTKQMNQNIDTMSLMDNASGVQQQYSGFMEDGGKVKKAKGGVTTSKEGVIKSYDDSFAANFGRLKGKFRENMPESFRTALPYVSDVEDALGVQEAFSKHGTTKDRIITLAGLSIPFVSTALLKRFLKSDKVKKLLDSDIGNTAYEQALNEVSSDSPNIEVLEKNLKQLEKKWGLSFEELNSPRIKGKDLKVATEPEDLGIGKYLQSGTVEYDNGFQLRKYTNPQNNSDDVFIMYDPKTENNIAYMRKYGQDPNSREFIPTSIPENTFHIKADMGNLPKEDVKFAMEELQKVLPPKHTIYESSNISPEGLKMFEQQKKFGYNPTDKTFTTKISNAGREGSMFSDLNRYGHNSDQFSEARFLDDNSLNTAINRVNDYQKKIGTNYNIYPTTQGRGINIDLPYLQREFADGGKLKAINPIVTEDIDYELMPIAPNRIYTPELSFNRRGTDFREEANKIDGELQLLSQKKKLSNKDKAKMIELERNKRALFEYQENPNTKKFASGGKITNYAMGGDLQMLDGNAELMSVNPYSPENGETVMLNGPSHAEGGMEINYGGNPVEAEGGEPVMKGRDGDLTIFGNMKIGKELLPLLGDEKAKGKKFKNYIADLSREEEKVASLKDKSIMKASEMDLKVPLDKLTLNSHKLNAIGSDAKLQKIADKKGSAMSLQQSMLDATAELNLDPDEFSKGKIKKAKMGTTIPKAINGYTAEGLEILTPEEHDHLRNLYRTAAGGNAKLVEAFQKEFHRIAPNRAKKILSGYDVTNYGKMKGMTNEQLESNEDGIFGKRTKQYIGLTDEIQPITDEPQDDVLARLTAMVKPPKVQEEVITDDTEPYSPQEKNRLAMLQLLSSALPYFRPTDAEDLDPRQLMGELYALSQNDVEPVKAQTFTPDLAAPYEISLQDQLNEITASERASQRNLGYNPAAQSILSSEAYKAKSNVLAEQLRMNQAMKDKTFGENRNLLNQAKLQNLQILDNQYVRQEQAKSNTKDTKLAALNSIASKYAQNELERKTLQTYENMYNYRYGDNMRAQNWNAPVFFNPEGSDLQPTDTPREGRVKSYIQDASGNFILHDVVSDQKRTTKSRNGSLVSAYKNL